MADEIVQCTPESWVDEVRATRDAGFAWFCSLGCVDEAGRADELRLVVRLVRHADSRARQLHVRVPRDEPRIDSLVELFAGASWYEREVRDFFGVTFVGGDNAPLLNHNPSIRPLRKDFVLAARAGQPWPGAKEPGEGARAASRRRMAPPGVPDPSVWGDRDPSSEAPTAAELAAAVAGGRVRRR